MAFWKNINGQIYDDMNGAALLLPSWPIGLTQITQTQADAIRSPTLAQLQSSAISKTYSDVDAVYFAAVGNREEEYKDAEVVARAFKAAGHIGTVSLYISHWAAVKGFTNQQATDAIIAKADSLAAAKLALRNTRFDSQAAMTAATTQAQLDAAVASWNAFIASTKTSLGLP